MIVEEALIARVTAPTSATYALVGTRVTPDYIPDTMPLPAVYMQRVPRPPVSELNIDQTIDHLKVLFNFTCVAAQNEKFTALRLADAIRTDLHGYRYADPTLTIICAFYNRQTDGYDGDTRRHKIDVEIEVWFNPSPP